MKKKTKKIRKIITQNNKNFRDYKITLSPTCIEAMRPRRINATIRYYDRKEDRQRKLHTNHDTPCHFDGCRSVVTLAHRPCFYKKTHANSIVPDFVNEMSMFKEIERKEEQQRKKNNLQKIYRVISQLPEKQKRRFILRYHKGLSVKEIAALENVCCVSIYESLKRAKAHIKDKLEINNEQIVTYKNI